MATAVARGGQEMMIGRVLARAFAALGAAPVLFLGVSLVLVALPSALAQLATRAAVPVAAPPGANPFAYLLPTIVAGAVVWWLLYMAAQAILFRATVAQIDGRPATLGAYAAAGARALLPLVALAILLSLAVWFASLLLIVPGIMLAVMWSVAAPALVIERTGVFAAFGRSRRLTKGARWRIFGLVLLVFALYFAAAATLGLGANGFNGFAARTATPATPTALTTIVSLVLQTGFVAIWTAIQAALYVDLRDWKDGPAGERLADIFA